MLNAYPPMYDETSIPDAFAEIRDMARLMPNPKPASRYAACRFCGQFQDFTGASLPWGTDIIEEATLRCDCGLARAYADKLEAKQKAIRNRVYALMRAQDTSEEMFGEIAVGFGKLPVREEIKQHILEAATLIYDRRIKGATIDVTPSVKVKISKSSKDKLTFQRTDSAVSKQEVDSE